ncbi:MAG: Cyanophycinase [bacterium ADurb.Bin478]|nr:MAG: Cyanophycinase [bacterium ADurb.Bin478]
MKKTTAAAMIILLAGLMLCHTSERKGYLMIVGGGDKPMDAMQAFVDHCQGKPVVIITSASSDLEYGNFTAGNRLGGTGAEKALNRLYYERGGIIGGTSAGAAAMSEVMITGNELVNKDSTNIFHSIQAKNVETKRGFGFIKNAIIDQHFMMRKRHNRLIAVVLEHPELPGIGIDEEAAILVYPDGRFKVYGKDAVIVYDARKAKEIRVSDQGLLGGRNIKVDLLLPGEVYSIE